MLFEPSDRNYSETITINSTIINPIEKKMLVGDTIEGNDVVYTSKYRSDNKIPGILVYSGQTYGRHKEKMLYKCVPNDRRLPIFLIPYLQKKSQFNKAKINKFILFEIREWKDKHPLASITNTLGDVNNKDIYCDYQLYCKNLHVPIQILNKKTTTALWDYKDNDVFDSSGMENREDRDIITIDPEGSVDFDDALGITTNTSGDSIISVYISNVSAVIERLGLWGDISDRVSTIYLPSDKKPMLPSKLSDNICSLLEGQRRAVVAMDLYVSSTGEITNVKYCNCVINVRKNYIYNEKVLNENDIYSSLLLISRTLNDSMKYVDNISDSHDVVAFYMILMNHTVGSYLAGNKVGIFRNVNLKPSDTSCIVAPEILRDYLKIYRNVEANYGLYSDNNRHDLIGDGIDHYSQVTSPIRRMVDLVNIMLLQDSNNTIKLSGEAKDFIKKWTSSIEYLNQSMRSIRRVQNDCNMLYHCLNLVNKNQEYNGFVVSHSSKYERYMVYIPEIKLTGYIKSETILSIFEQHRFTMHIFNDEVSLKQKVRLQIIL